MPKMPDAVVLCGGAGLRLRPVIGEAAKAMATVSGRPFLEVLFRQIARHGFNRAILAVGYQQDEIRSHFGTCVLGLHLVYSPEQQALGTGGALRNAADRIETDSVLVMNGDSYTDVDLGKFVEDYREAKADASVVLVPADGRVDCGFVSLDQAQAIVGFEEKQFPAAGCFVNSGIYLFSRSLIYEITADQEASLERDLLPLWLRQAKNVKGFIHQGSCVDIGTPERYREAQAVLANVEEGSPLSGCESSL